MIVLRLLGGLLLAVLLLLCAALVYALYDRWPAPTSPYGEMPEGWRPNPRTLVHTV